MNKREAGKRGEDLAIRHLKKRGYRIVARNFRTPLGEIDIIAKDGETLTFIEVKTSTSSLDPIEAITPSKIHHITRVAHLFLKSKGREDQDCRFDVVAVHNGEVELVKGAFFYKW